MMQVENAEARRLTRAAIATLERRALALIAKDDEAPAGCSGTSERGGLKTGDDAFFFAEAVTTGRLPIAAGRIASNPVVRFAQVNEKVGGVPCRSANTLKVRISALFLNGTPKNNERDITGD